MNELCKEHFPRQLENLQTIPGVKERSATAIIAELGVDMKTFLTASALVGWCGLKPRNEESAGKRNSALAFRLVFILDIALYHDRI